jgi:hypothetical protein
VSISSLLQHAEVKRAAIALGGAVVLIGWAGVRATRLDVVPGAAPTPIETSALNGRTQREATDIADALASDPFSATRTPPSKRYALPWEADEGKVVEATAKPIVLGTAMSLDGSSFATCQLGEDRPRIVRVGDKLGTYTVKSIARGRVAFTTSSGSILDVSALK